MKTSDQILKDNLAILAIKTKIFQGPRSCATLPLAALLCKKKYLGNRYTNVTKRIVE